MAYGNEHISDEVNIDYFTVSLPELLISNEDPNVGNKIHCNCEIGLGEFGIRNVWLALNKF